MCINAFSTKWNVSQPSNFIRSPENLQRAIAFALYLDPVVSIKFILFANMTLQLDLKMGISIERNIPEINAHTPLQMFSIHNIR